MKLINNPSIGTDFELFLMHKRTKEIVSAEGIIQGTKYVPFVFDPENPYFSTSLDNVLAEATIPPVNNVNDWVANIAKSRNYIESILPEHLCTAAIPAAILKPRYLATENAQIFGCERDLNVWLRQENEMPKAKNKRLRSAGAHIHVGYDNPELETTELGVKALDLFIGIPSVLQEPDNERKLLYGKAGAFRIKDYGFEYRTVSNYYLETKELTEWVFGATIKALDFVNDGGGEELETVKELIQEAINTNNKIMAQNLINQFNLQLV